MKARTRSGTRRIVFPASSIRLWHPRGRLNNSVAHDRTGRRQALADIEDARRRIAGVIRATHPTFRYTPTAPPQELHNAGRVHWVSGPPEGPPAYAGVDFIIVREGKIAELYLFFDSAAA